LILFYPNFHACVNIIFAVLYRPILFGKKQATQQRQGIKNETIYFAHRHYFGDI